MYKKIKQGQHLTITGANLYSGVDTAVYFNSVEESTRAEIISSGFNNEDTRLKILVPSGLPEENKLIVYNGYGYATGVNPYKFIGAPIISGFSPTSQFWNQNVTLSGNYLENTTGIFVSDKKVTSYDWPSKTQFSFRVPRGLSSGQIFVYTDVGVGGTQDYLSCATPQVSANLHSSSQGEVKHGDAILLEGEALHNVNRLAFSGIQGDMYMTTFSGIDTTGIKFLLPEGVVDNSPVRAQKESGYFNNGIFVQNIEEESSTLDNLNIVSSHIHNLSKTQGYYNQPLTLSGVNLNKSKILFKDYNDQYVSGALVSSGHNYVTVSIPRGIKNANVLASGETVYTSEQSFYPLPTIAGMSSVNWTAGETISISGINASEIVYTVGVSGKDLVSNVSGVHFASNSSANSDGDNYFGSVSIDNSSLTQDAQNGYSIVNALINSSFVGEGYPFLVSAYESDDLNKVTRFDSALSGSSTYDNIHNIVGDFVRVSGKKPLIAGAQKTRVNKAEIIELSGNYFYCMTGVELFNGSESVVLAKSGLQDITPLSKIRTSITGNVNSYEQMHTIQIDLSNFSQFQNKNGTLRILTPYHGQ